jgi:hypothetical protein
MTAATAVKKRSTGEEIEEGGWSIEYGVGGVGAAPRAVLVCIG